MTRTVHVAYDRLPRWLATFAERHGDVVVDGDVVRAADTCRAQVVSWAPVPPGVSAVDTLIAALAPPADLGIVLIRRGGYAVARCVDGDLASRKVGRRHVQSRTAAGGWSQQRFARRRGNQADELVGAVTTYAVEHLAGHRLAGAVVGGDKALVAAVLAEPRLAAFAALPRRELFDLPDPTPAVLTTAVTRARSVRIELTDPGS